MNPYLLLNLKQIYWPAAPNNWDSISNIMKKISRKSKVILSLEAVKMAFHIWENSKYSPLIQLPISNDPFIGFTQMFKHFGTTLQIRFDHDSNMDHNSNMFGNIHIINRQGEDREFPLSWEWPTPLLLSDTLVSAIDNQIKQIMDEIRIGDFAGGVVSIDMENYSWKAQIEIGHTTYSFE